MIDESELTPWLKGKPTLVGEYNASRCLDEMELRWFDGKLWSIAYFSDYVKNRKNNCASIYTWDDYGIKYRGLANPPK